MLKLNWYFKYLILFLGVYALHLVISIAPGDDIWFMNISQEKTSLLEYLHWRYTTWSGRIFAEMGLYYFLDGKVWLWRIVNSTVIIASAYATVRLFKKNVKFTDTLFSLILVGYFSKSIMSSGFLWITGSFNYLWPICFGLIAMIPFSDIMFRGIKPGVKLTIASCLFGILAALSNEQVALCIIAFAVITNVLLFIKRKEYSLLILPNIFMIIAGSILLLAPGSDARYQAEVARWYPGFDTMSITEHIHIGLFWFYEKLFGELKGIILLLTAIAVYIIHTCSDTLQSKRMVFLKKLLTCLSIVLLSIQFIPGASSIFYNFGGLKEVDISYNLINFWKAPLSFWLLIIPYIFWTSYGLILGYVLVNISRSKIFITLCFAAAMCSMIIIFFSPTIYASGNRVLTISASLLLVAGMHLIFERKIVPSKLLSILLAIYPMLNIVDLFLNWIINGYSPLL